MTKDEELEAAYLAGFNASGEGYNGEYPFEHKGKNCTDDPIWCKDRDNELAAIKQALAAQPAAVQEPVKWSDYEPDGRRYPVVPDAMTSADIQEHIEYVAGWNDCRQAMLEMMK
jgi:hypothetical protein